MKETLVLGEKILSDLKGLPRSKISEVIDFIEYLKVRQKSWRERFKTFLNKIEPKMKKVAYSEIAKEIAKVRGK